MNLAMEFLVWHYTKGLEYFIQSFLSILEWVIQYFSPFLLLKSLFAPWKRLVVIDKTPGFNFTRWFQSFTFNLVSRIMGALVRLTLLVAGFFILIFAFLGGIVGLVIWVLVPLFGLPVFQKYKNQPENFVKKLVDDLKTSPKNWKEVIFATPGGKFILTHLGLNYDDTQEIFVDKDFSLEIVPESFSSLISSLVEAGLVKEEALRRKGASGDDLLIASGWWDRKQGVETEVKVATLGSPGVGLELLFGYTPTLNKYSVNLSTPQTFEHHLIGRENVVSQMERVLTSGKSISLVGTPGVGKKTVVLEFANRAIKGQFGPAMAFRRVYEFDHNLLLSESLDINLKKAKLSAILEEASGAGNIILMMRDLHRLTNQDVEGYDFTDVIEQYLGKKELKIISVTTPQEYERFIAPNLRLRKYLQKIEVTPPTKDEALQILLESASAWEEKKNIILEVPALRKLIEESDAYVSETPFPEKAIELLDALVTYLDQKGRQRATTGEVNEILAEKIGISFASLSKSEEDRLSNLEEVIHERLINQDAAVNLIAKSLRARTVGVTKSNRPLGSFLFLGPTGVGKTETAKVLAKVYYGSSDAILRFDMAEYSGGEGLERLIGSINKNLPGVLTTAIRNNPASLLLLDEIEKATPAIFNLFLALLDEGKITDAFGRVINCKNLFIIGTSNAGAEFIREEVNKGTSGAALQKTVTNYILEKGLFSPEFLNRFDGVVVYEPLSKENLVKIAKLLLEELAGNLKAKGIKLTITNELAAKLSEDGYDSSYGARPMRRIVNLDLGDLVSKAILSKEVKDGDEIEIVPGTSPNVYSVKKL